MRGESRAAQRGFPGKRLPVCRNVTAAQENIRPRILLMNDRNEYCHPGSYFSGPCQVAAYDLVCFTNGFEAFFSTLFAFSMLITSFPAYRLNQCTFLFQIEIID